MQLPSHFSPVFLVALYFLAFSTAKNKKDVYEIQVVSQESDSGDSSNDDDSSDSSSKDSSGDDSDSSESESFTYVRYLLLDRKCETIALKKKYIFTKSFRHHRSEKEKTNINCWVEIQDEGKTPGNVWNTQGEIKVLVHGWTPKTWQTADEMLLEQAIFKLGERYANVSQSHNILAVDYTYLVATPDYPKAAASTKLVGMQLARFLFHLQQQNKMEGDAFWDKLHLIGFSMGAHVCGTAGYYLQLKDNVKPHRITGVDPAGPEYDGPTGTWPLDDTAFLDKSDAMVVHLIHCNAGSPRNYVEAAALGFYGSAVAAGHADFYPNGGARQSRYCSRLDDMVGCSHMFCLKYFLNSVTNNTYVACPCSSWEKFQTGKCNCDENGKDAEIMGEACSDKASGKYYLKAKK